MRGNGAGDDHIAPRGGGGDHQRAGFDLVGNDGIVGTVQRTPAADADNRGTRAHHARAHAVEKIGQIHDVRLFGRVIDDGGARGGYRGEHGVHRRAHAGAIEVHFGPQERIAFHIDHAA